MRKALCFASLVLLIACAQQKSPTGGPRDTTPPKVQSADPLPMSTDFNSKKIEIYFDEYVQLEGIRDQVLISPPLAEEPEITLKNARRLIIDLGDQVLAENTTYTINLGEAVVDVNERNVLEENVYLFSTGQYIDSLELRGQLLKARYNDPCVSCMALLFPDLSDSLLIGARPAYVAKADASGFFYLSNLANASYRLMALEDMDADLRIDVNENFAFLSQPIEPLIVDSLGTILRMSKAIESSPRISYSEWALDGSYLELSYKGLDSLSDFFGDAAPNIAFIENLNLLGDSLRIWFRPALEQDKEFIVTLGEDADTLRVGRVAERNKDYQLQMVATLADQEADMLFNFSSPVESFDRSKLQLIRDSIPLDFVSNEVLPAMKMAISADWKPGNYSLTLLPGALKDLYGTENDTIKLSVKCASPESFGILSLNIDLPDSSTYLIELIDTKKKVIRTTTAPSDIQWKLDYLSAGSYLLRVVRDEDGDGRWTKGDFYSHKLPESVFMLPEPITVRSNWELEQEISVEFKH